MNYKDIYHRQLGPYTVPSDVKFGVRELVILNSRDTCSFPHHCNQDCDFYISDDCISYYSPTEGSFVLDTKSRKIVG